MNYIDLIILLGLGLFGLLGYRRGLIKEAGDLLILVVSFGCAFFLYGSLAKVGNQFLSIPQSFIKAGSFFLIWFIIEIACYIAMLYMLGRVDDEVLDSRWNIWGGIVLGLVKGSIFLFAISSTLMILPLGGDVEDDLSSSLSGKVVAKSTAPLSRAFEKTFGEAASTIARFTTISSGSTDKVTLSFKLTHPVLDQSSAKEMLASVNLERERAGFEDLVLDKKLSSVAEAHGKDMAQKGYLSHINLAGKSPFDRMKEAGISFFFAGENLALAEDADAAMKGLMESSGHKANILSGDYSKIGIAVIDCGADGKIFVQEFID